MTTDLSLKKMNKLTLIIILLFSTVLLTPFATERWMQGLLIVVNGSLWGLLFIGIFSGWFED